MHQENCVLIFTLSGKNFICVCDEMSLHLAKTLRYVFISRVYKTVGFIPNTIKCFTNGMCIINFVFLNYVYVRLPQSPLISDISIKHYLCRSRVHKEKPMTSIHHTFTTASWPVSHNTHAAFYASE